MDTWMLSRKGRPWRRVPVWPDGEGTATVCPALTGRGFVVLAYGPDGDRLNLPGGGRLPYDDLDATLNRADALLAFLNRPYPVQCRRRDLPDAGAAGMGGNARRRRPQPSRRR